MVERRTAMVAGGLGLLSALALGCGLIAGLGDFTDAPAHPECHCDAGLRCSAKGSCVACLTGLDCPGTASCTAEGACKDAVVWSRRYGDAADQVLSSVSTDKQGNIFIGGYFKGTFDLGSGTPLTSASPDHPDILLAKLDPSGKMTWAKRYGNGTSDQGTALGLLTTGTQVAADPGDGSVVFAALYLGAVDFEGTTYTSTGTFYPDFVLAKLHADGTLAWKQEVGNADNSSTVKEVLRLGVAPGGAIHLAGSFKETLTFPPQPSVTSTGAAAAFFAVLDADGGATGVKAYGSTGMDPNTLYDFGFASAFTPSDTSWVFVASASGPIDFGNGPLDGGVPDLSSACVVKLNAKFKYTWASCSATPSAGSSWNRVLPSDNDAILVGKGNSTSTMSELVVQRVTKFGTVIYTKHFGGGAGNKIESRPVATLTSSNNVLIASTFSGTLDLGQGPMVSPAGHTVGFVLELDGDGRTLWSARFGQDVAPHDAAMLPGGEVVLGGVYTGSLDVLANDPQPAAGGLDAFLIALAVP